MDTPRSRARGRKVAMSGGRFAWLKFGLCQTLIDDGGIGLIQQGADGRTIIGVQYYIASGINIRATINVCFNVFLDFLDSYFV